MSASNFKQEIAPCFLDSSRSFLIWTSWVGNILRACRIYTIGVALTYNWEHEMMKNLSTSIFILVLNVLLFGCAPNAPDSVSRAGGGKENQMQQFIASHIEKVRPLQKEQNLAWWNAATMGKPEDYDKASELTLKIRQLHSDPQEFAFLKESKESGQVEELILAREVDVLYRSYLENQIQPELLKAIVDLSTEIEEKFSTFRGAIDGEKVTDNQIKEILKTQTDSNKRKQAWLASKQVGAATDLVELVEVLGSL